MISLYTGTVGSGKSYHALELSLNWIRTRKHVVANFPIKLKDIRRNEKKKERWLYREEITIEYLMALSVEKGWFGKESQCLVVIDEAGIMFNSRDWQTAKGSRMKWIQFLSQSRKFGYDFIFVCQNDRMIDKQIRGLVEYEVKHMKANNAFFFKWLSMFKITIFMYNYKWYQTKLKGKMQMSIYKPFVANKYDTMKIFNLDELIDNMRKVYEGKVIPAAVLSQIAIWKEQLVAEELKRKQEEQEETKEGKINDVS